jgi:hypothetical protein
VEQGEPEPLIRSGLRLGRKDILKSEPFWDRVTRSSFFAPIKIDISERNIKNYWKVIDIIQTYHPVKSMSSEPQNRGFCGNLPK